MLDSWASLRSDGMAAKPKGFDEFDKLTRKLAAVPKEQVDAKIAADKAARAAKRKKKK